MNSYDPELLAALAEGSLSPADAAALEIQIAADPAALAELGAQRQALAFLQSGVAPRLRDDERTALRAAIATQLGLVPDSAPVRPPRRRVAWGAIAVSASAVAAIIALAPMVGLLGDRGGDDAAMTVADGSPILDEDAARDAAPLGSQFPPSAQTGDATVPLISTAAGGEDSAATTAATAYAENAADLTKITEDLTLLRSDPEGLQVVAGPTDATTPCREEAVAYLGSDLITWFPYPYPPQEPGAMVATIEYAVFILGDTTDGTATLVAFAPDDCAVAIPVP
jgi:hypothetical protein